MNVRYICGIAGSGKTNLCLDEIYEKSKISNNNLIYIVPEQFTLSSEKNLVNKFPSGVLLNINILSFKRLAHTLFSEIGALSSKVLGDTGKLILIRKIAYENAKNLTYFKKSIDKDGFLENIGKTITEFFKYNISVDCLEKKLDTLDKNTNLYEKLKDLYIIYKEYKNYLNKEYISNDETLDLLAEKIKHSNLIKDAEIWIDEFSGFTPQEFNVIKELFKYAKQVNITFCINTKKHAFKTLSNFDIFYEIKSSMNKLTSLAKEANATILENTCLEENYRQKGNPQLYHLTTNYLKINNNDYKRLIQNVTITYTKNKYFELNTLASNILTLVREENYNYRDIAVILGDNSYEDSLKSTFNQYDIPFFIDTKKDISSNRISELVSAFFDIFTTNWSYDAIFRFLKTELTPMVYLDICILENYVLECGIKGSMWNIPEWKYGFTNPNFNEDDINYLKDLFIDILKPFTNYIKPGKKYYIKEITFRLYNFLVSLELEKLITNSDSEDLKVYNSLMELFDKLVELLGEQEVTISEYSKILNAGIKSCKIGHLPKTQDEVIIGDLKRTRLSKIKALFILSVNEGVIPETPVDNGILSDDDKNTLTSDNFELSPTALFQINQDNFLIYSMLSKPTEKLFLSYTIDKRPSKIIQKVKNILPKLEEKNDNITALEKVTLPTPSFTELSIPLYDFSKGNELDDIYKDLYAIFSQKEEYKLKLKKMENILFYNDVDDYLPLDTVSKIYNNTNIHSSITKLEKFASCPFSYFMTYTLQAKERNLYKLNSLDIGSIFHKILDDFSTYVIENKLNWSDLTAEIINKTINSSLTEISTETKNKIFTTSAKYKFMLSKIKSTAYTSIDTILKHINTSKFKPIDSEVDFGIKSKYNIPAIIIELDNNKKLFLTGKIDRIDILEGNEFNYVKILDFKTSTNPTLNLVDIYYGLQLQLLIYLDVLLKNGKKIFNSSKEFLPGAILYFRVHEPVYNTNTVSENIDLSKVILENLQSFNENGLILEDNFVLQMIDVNNTSKSTMYSIEVKNGMFSCKKDLSSVTLDEFNELRNYVLRLSQKFGNDIISGNIKISPYKKGSGQSEKTSCDYCNYKAICQISIKDKEIYRDLNTLQNPLEKIIEVNKNNSEI